MEFPTVLFHASILSQLFIHEISSIPIHDNAI